MRLWSLHPRYLDVKGLVALWREGLLARKVLRGETKGYRKHPQLERFWEQDNTLAFIDVYLSAVCGEASRRGYRFDRTKIAPPDDFTASIPVTEGQLLYEWQHLLQKLHRRDPEHFEKFRNTEAPEPHPLFMVVAGEVAFWEKI